MIKNFYEKGLYRKTPINSLILLGIYSTKGECSFESLVKETFTLFPKAFGFHSYPKWPDSRKLDRSLRTLRRQGLIAGDPKTYFSLTKKGKKIAEELTKLFRQERLKFK